MIFSSKIIVLSTPMAAISTGSLYIYKNYWPKTMGDWLQMEGIEIIGHDEQLDYWKSTFNDHRGEVEELKLENLTPTTPENDAFPILKNGCQTNLKNPGSEDLEEKIFKYCIYIPRTVKGLIMGSGKFENFITEDEDYKIIFTLFSSLLFPSIETLHSNENPESAKPKIKAGCNEELNKKIETSSSAPKDYSKIFVFCTKPPARTVKERIEKNVSDGTVMEDGFDNENGKAAFDRGKYTQEIISLIGKSSPETTLDETTEREIGGPKMKEGCTRGLEKSLSEDGVYPGEYRAIKSACSSAN